MPSHSFWSSAGTRKLHSFPTRRSSDLGAHLAVVPVARHEHEHRDKTVEAIAAHQHPHARALLELQYRQRKTEQRIFIEDRKSTRLNSSHVKISYAVFCLKKKKNKKKNN